MRNQSKILPLPTETVIKEYKEGITPRNLAKKYGCSKCAITGLLKRNKVELRGVREGCQKIKCNRSFFHVIDSEDKAYWLGFLYADGNIYNGKVQIRLAKKDLEHLEKLKSSLSSDHRIYKDLDKRTNEYCVGLIIPSADMADDLRSHGCVEKKTFLIRMPELREDLMRHFIRGYFDGDGCFISFTTKKGYKKWTLQINSNMTFCSQILKKIQKDADINIGKTYKEKRRISDCGCFIINTSKKETLVKIYKYLYDGSSVYLDRKKQKIEKHLESYKK
jgi:intein-encoded DNA endonuclease-like protein